MKTAALVAVALALALAGSVEVSAQEKMCWKEGWVIDADSATYPLYASHPSYGTWFDKYPHKEYVPDAARARRGEWGGGIWGGRGRKGRFPGTFGGGV